MKDTVWSLPVLLLLALLRPPPGAAFTAAPDGDKPRVQALLEAAEPRGNGSRDHCLRPPRVGPCRASFPRFFYNVSSQNCSSFIYGGCESNDNNFLSEEECREECSGVTGSVLPDDWSPPSAAPAAPSAAPSAAPAAAPAAPAAPSAPSAVKAPRRAPPPPPPPSPTGPTETQKNESSTDNQAEGCRAEPEVGPCRAAFPRWFYNWRTGSCESFVYGGCNGNQNNYQTKDSCLSSCAGRVSHSKKLSDDDEELCSATPDPGPCRAAFPMFYYDRRGAACRSFLYGGCQGNRNRFDTVEECLSRCSSPADPDRRDQNRNRWTAAIFLFITLAFISILLLVSLVIVTLRRHRVPRRTSSCSDKEELLPEDQSSLDSLSVPGTPIPSAKA